MDDALIGIGDVEQGEPRLMGGGAGLGDEGLPAGHQRPVVAAGARVDDMVHHAEDACGIGDGPPGRLQAA